MSLTYTFTVLDYTALSKETQLAECSNLFDNNYGRWANVEDLPARMHGKPVRLPKRKLAEQCLGDPGRSVLAICRLGNADDGLLIGHAFATTWDTADGRTVGWITQLVVDKAHRRNYIATSLLQALKRSSIFANVSIVGLASSHPASCHALAKLGRVKIEEVDLNFIAANANAILKTTTVEYLRGAEVRGTIFGTQNAEAQGVVTSIFTTFFVDHTEPLQVLETYTRRGAWKLGNLLDGAEFLIIVPMPPSEVTSVVVAA